MSRDIKLLAGASITDISQEASYNYYLYVRDDNSWVILRENVAQTEYRYATGISDITIAWTNRASQNYKRANEFSN